MLTASELSDTIRKLFNISLAGRNNQYYMRTRIVSNSISTFLWLFVIVIAVSFSFLNYWRISQEDHAGLLSKRGMFYHDPVVKREAYAPYQYRIGLPYIAEYVRSHSSLQLRHIYGCYDALSIIISMALLTQYILKLNPSPIQRQLECVIVFGLWLFQLLWTLTWYAVPYTFPSLLYVTCIYMLSNKWCYPNGRAKRVFIVFSMVVLSLFFSLVRPDVCFAIGLGYFLSALSIRFLMHSKNNASDVNTFGLISAAIVVISVIIQAYMIHLYSNANYGNVKAIQLYDNLSVWRMVPFLLFLFPIAYAYIFLKWEIPNKNLTYPENALIVTCIVYFPIWVLLGKIDEVRIIVPFTFPLMPLLSRHLVKGIIRDAANQAMQPTGRAGG